MFQLLTIHIHNVDQQVANTAGAVVDTVISLASHLIHQLR